MSTAAGARHERLPDRRFAPSTFAAAPHGKFQERFRPRVARGRLAWDDRRDLAVGHVGFALGAGLVQLGVPACCQAWIAPLEPSYMTMGLPCDDDGRISSAARPHLAELASQATALGIGPGLGQSAGLTEMVAWLYGNLQRPMICDADALNALAHRPKSLHQHAGPRIFTPHPGEFRRLVPGDKQAKREAVESQAQTLAADAGLVIVLKGHRTFITDGKQSATIRPAIPAWLPAAAATC